MDLSLYVRYLPSDGLALYVLFWGRVNFEEMITDSVDFSPKKVYSDGLTTVSAPALRVLRIRI